MGVPVSQMWTVASYVLRSRSSRAQAVPARADARAAVPLQLACAGCGKIQYPAHILKNELTPEQCFQAVEECGAPMVASPAASR